MRYRIINVLSFFKREIEKLEKRMEDEEKDYWKKKQLESLIRWNFEKAIEMIRFDEEHGKEVDQETLGWFFAKKEEMIRPDLRKLEKQIEKGRSRNWLQKIWDEIRWR